MKRCIDEVNLLHPDFVLISGDLVYGQLYPFEYSREYKKCYELIQRFDVPTFLAPGNHDGYRRIGEDGLEIWKEYFGPLYYSFDYGNYHFMAINSYDWLEFLRLSFFFIPLNWGGSIRDEQLGWIEKDLQNTNSNLTFMFLHHNPLWDTKSDSLFGISYNNREEFLSLIDNNNVDMVLAGHVHYDSVNVTNNTTFITTTTPGSAIRAEDGYWGFRKVEIRNGKIFSYNYKEPKYSIPTYKLSYHFKNPYTVIAKNDLEKDMNVTFKFLVPKGQYTVENGQLIMQREDDIRAEIYVQSELEKKNVNIIKIKPV